LTAEFAENNRRERGENQADGGVDSEMAAAKR